MQKLRERIENIAKGLDDIKLRLDNLNERIKTLERIDTDYRN